MLSLFPPVIALLAYLISLICWVVRYVVLKESAG